MSLSESVLEGNRLSLARLLSEVENGTVAGFKAINELYSLTGKAHLIGVTGASGTGKSSLVNQLALNLRNSSIQNNESVELPRVAIVAVDPSSPFTGGAILGDRIRMRELAGDSGIFIRSMASRGSLGGLAKATTGVVQILDAAGYEVILIETVGAGQTEVDIARLAHTTLVVMSPGLGDEIQAIKAGILEIADLLVINKADLPGIDATERALQGMLQLAHPARREFINHHGQGMFYESQPIVNKDPVKNTPEVELRPEWVLNIYKTNAIDGIGISELIGAIKKHFHYLRASGEWYQRDKARLRSEFDMLLMERLVNHWRETIADQYYTQVLEKVYDREVSPWQAVKQPCGGTIAMIIGDRLRLRSIERDDLPRYVGWLNDPEVRENLMLFLPLSQAEEEVWFENMLKTPAIEHPLAIEIQVNEQWLMIGNCGLFNFNNRARSAELGIFIGDKSSWNKGYGTEAVQLMVQHGFETLNLNRISLEVFDDNPRAMSAYTKSGFVVEGRKRQGVFKKNHYVDVILMSVLRSEWEGGD